ncbi:DUF4215 domain-containing protein [Hyalangium versicolor]|uniref:DUF4215 domain-containing protein n=1 Tax=Hyalangium versicolor TaxID=2861190 RepID=UPI001CCC3435|nr:DUF4215 domain-containing protein [Hyalangium versicolor]
MLGPRSRSSFSNLIVASLLVAVVGCVGDPPDGPHIDPGDGGSRGDGGPGDGGPNNPDGGPNNPDGGPNNPDGGPTNPDGGPITLECGNRVIQAGEACDDGNTNAGDGCAADCKTVESGWFCDVAGPCTRNVCGDGRTGSTEACDDRNTTPNDGCSATCTIEPGYSCPPGGGRCTAARCGDGIVAGDEECEDNDNPPGSGDGCSDKCRLERGYKCPVPGQACVATTCGDTIVEGTEQCDDGNNNMGDGCSPLCVREPNCSNGSCTAVCGDGVILPGDNSEECDDGNLRANDGCSPECKFEPGFHCETVADDPPPSVEIPIVYRDFIGKGTQDGGTNLEHADFNSMSGDDRGMLANQLGADGKPVYARTDGSHSPTTTSKALFDQWYRDTPNVNKTVVSTLTLARQSSGAYQFSNSNFFPLDGLGWVATKQEKPQNNGHNFSFTSEVRYWFEYKGTEVLEFIGDDDVWVFINDRLAVDLGGVHGAETGSVTLSQRSDLGLQLGKVYDAIVLQAERHTTQSNYKLTLTNFVTRRTKCENSCGDGVVQAPEQCDNGTANNTGGYGQCSPTCTLGPRCGDGVIQSQAGEECDDGNTNNGDACSNACQVIFG